MKKIAVLTTGGDAPGMNPAIRSVVRYGISQKLEVVGVFRGWWGLINEELKPLSHRSVSGIIGQGGTILKTARCPEFRTEEGQNRAYETIKKNNIDGLVVIGGNGSFAAAHEFYKKFNIPCVGIAASIDNDVNGIDYTIGTDVMGRDSGFIALTVALTGGCEEVIIPEKELDLNLICHDIVHGDLVGKMSWIIVIAEGAGKADDIARQITDMTGLETRTVVLGHVQRGGRPTAASRDLALNFGKAAVDCLMANKTDIALGLTAGKIAEVDFETAIRKKEFKIDNFYKLLKILT